MASFQSKVGLWATSLVLLVANIKQYVVLGTKHYYCVKKFYRIHSVRNFKAIELCSAVWKQTIG